MANETRYDIGAERTKELHSNAIVPVGAENSSGVMTCGFALA